MFRLVGAVIQIAVCAAVIPSNLSSLPRLWIWWWWWRMDLWRRLNRIQISDQRIYLHSSCYQVQFILAAPFLTHDPIAYISGAFNFSRTFMHRSPNSFQLCVIRDLFQGDSQLGFSFKSRFSFAAFSPFSSSRSSCHHNQDIMLIHTLCNFHI